MVHQYKLNGYNIVLDSCSGSIHVVDDVAYDIIAMYQDNSPEKIVKLLNECFRLDTKAEEYVYMLAFDAKCNPLGVFELGHGSVNACILNPREIFQRALICGAVNIVIAHNHPSHDTTPSKDDDVAASKISEAGKLMKIQLVDFIIIGNGYFSYAEEKRV